MTRLMEKQFNIRYILNEEERNILKKLKGQTLSQITNRSANDFWWYNIALMCNEDNVLVRNEIQIPDDGAEYATLRIKKIESVPDKSDSKIAYVNVRIGKEIQHVKVIRDQISFRKLAEPYYFWNITCDIAIKLIFTDDTEWVIMAPDSIVEILYVFELKPESICDSNEEISKEWTNYWRYKTDWADQWQRLEIDIC